MNEELPPPQSSLFEELVALWGGSISSPTVTNLRQLASKGFMSEEDAERILALPFSMDDMMDLFIKYQDVMSKEFSHDPGIPFHIDVVHLYKENFKLGKNSKMVVFEDSKSEEELVYGILVNQQSKRTTLTFRGSVTKRDYQADSKFWMRSIVDSQGRRVQVHQGIADYLFKSDSEESKSEKANETKGPKYKEIVKKLRDVYAKYPDHQLYVTGHSLGGSLGLLASFQLAEDEYDFLPSNLPIKAFLFGPMLVGNLQFLRSFQRLEADGKVQCAVILNEGDIIPLLPLTSGYALYRTIGKRVTLADHTKKKKTPRIYSPTTKSKCIPDCLSLPGFHIPQFLYILGCTGRFWIQHTVATTMANISASEKDLRALTLDGLYEQE